jgi:tetratricopeptide (TPR) repeat protein
MGAGQAPGGMPAGQPGPERLTAMADKKAAPLLEELNKNPNDAGTLTKVGSFYFAARQFDKAASYFEKSVKIKPTPDALTKLSNAYFYGGDADKAIATLNQALQMDPKFANALYNLGMLKWQAKGDVKGAIACWETLVKTNPHHPQIEQVKQMIARAKAHEKMPAGTKTDKTAM